MLLGINALLSPDLLATLSSMGHGDEIVLGDRNFPAETVSCRLIRADGHSVCDMLTAVLSVFPLDDFEPDPAVGMSVINGDGTLAPALVDMQDVIRNEVSADLSVAQLERHAFYDRAQKAFAVVATGEVRFYGNIILRKGVIAQE